MLRNGRNGLQSTGMEKASFMTISQFAKKWFGRWATGGFANTRANILIGCTGANPYNNAPMTTKTHIKMENKAQIDWATAPEWANWFAVDSTGNGFFMSKNHLRGCLCG